MFEAPAFERLLKRDRVITLAGLTALCALAWLYIVTGAGLGMSAWEMTTLALFPHQHTRDVMPEHARHGHGRHGTDVTAWGFATWALMIAMWWIMMIAMMTPSAAPTILLYARVHRHALAQGQIPRQACADRRLRRGLSIGLARICRCGRNSALGAGTRRLVSAMMMGSQSRLLSGAVLIAAGLYQLSPLKNICLAHCRTPTSFFAPLASARSGALRSAMHGAYCVGCCWMLMALLFVGGVMNLTWIAALAILVLIEKVLPPGQWVGRVVGIALIVWGVATLVV